ncbi:thioesterase family protein [Selenomonas sp. KH1T6]|uniref:thioesterase family protein n=1 Tax=Selenomonas sp. KH1T6 TaxID=3158784 RepID=UPI0008A7B2D0|nr:Predicted thioesterase [Selenomonas ruminantium]
MEIKEIKPGMKHEVTDRVTEDKTAGVMGSGSLPVYATPAMSCLMEKAAAELAETLLPEGYTSVGGAINILHKAPTPLRGRVRAEAVVESVEGPKITYRIAAYDEVGLIGEGTHERFAVNEEKFMNKAAARLQS